MFTRNENILKQRSVILISLGAISCLLLFIPRLYAHADLQLQIEQLTEQISHEPNNTQLLLKRGDLYRRHGDWDAGRSDFEKVRRLQPDHPVIDWFDGRLFVASGQYREGDILLTRYLLSSPDHSGAYRMRAVARGNLHQPLLAAADYQSAINHSKRPSPSLFRALVLSYVKGGTEYADAALSATDEGLSRFPNEVSLLGLGVDLSLSQSDLKAISKYLADVPPGLMNLPQWQFRDALLTCVEGRSDAATALFSNILLNSAQNDSERAGTWILPTEQVTHLAIQVSPGECSEVAWDMLLGQTP